MNKIPYEQRMRTYSKALICYGVKNQMIVALEELSECQKEICKLLRGEGNVQNLAEEIADATIMLEQMRTYFAINGMVYHQMDEKVSRLEKRMKEVREFETRQKADQAAEHLYPQQKAQSCQLAGGDGHAG